MCRILNALCLSVLLVPPAFLPAQTTTTPGKISFARDIAPVLTQKCMQCHGHTPLMGGLDLRTRETALKGGQHGAAIVPGNAAASSLQTRLSSRISTPATSTPMSAIAGPTSFTTVAICVRVKPRSM